MGCGVVIVNKMNFAYLFKWIVVGDQSTRVASRCRKEFDSHAVPARGVSPRLRDHHRGGVRLQDPPPRPATHQTSNMGHSTPP